MCVCMWVIASVSVILCYYYSGDKVLASCATQGVFMFYKAFYSDLPYDIQSLYLTRLRGMFANHLWHKISHCTGCSLRLHITEGQVHIWDIWVSAWIKKKSPKTTQRGNHNMWPQTHNMSVPRFCCFIISPWCLKIKGSIVLFCLLPWCPYRLDW